MRVGQFLAVHAAAVQVHGLCIGQVKLITSLCCPGDPIIGVAVHTLRCDAEGNAERGSTGAVNCPGSTYHHSVLSCCVKKNISGI